VIEKTKNILKKKYILPKYLILYFNSILNKIVYGSLIFMNVKEILRKFEIEYKKLFKKFFYLPKNTSSKTLEYLIGINSIEKKMWSYKVACLMDCCKQDDTLMNYIKETSFKYGFPGLPCNFGWSCKKTNFIEELSNKCLKEKIRIYTYKEDKFSVEQLKIRARKNILKRNSFFFPKKNYNDIRKKLNYQIKYNNYKKIKEIKIFCEKIPSLFFNDLQITKKKNIKNIFKKTPKDSKKINFYDSIKIIRIKALLLDNNFPTLVRLNNYDKNKKTDLKCKLCKKNDETFEHLLFQCPRTKNIRKKQNF